MRLNSDPVPLEVPADRREELKKVIAEMLLNVAIEEVKHDA